MGSGGWFKAIIGLKRSKENKVKQLKVPSTNEKSNGFKWRSHSRKDSSSNFLNCGSGGDPAVLGMSVVDVAARQIQNAFRAFMARKTVNLSNGIIDHSKGIVNHSKGIVNRSEEIVKLQVLTQGDTAKKQASTTLNYLHSWSRIQAQIRARRLSMVTEGRIRQKKLENQLKLEAKLHELEVEWCGGSDTMEEILARIQQREEAAVKRERAMAYAFSHQWRANSSRNQGQVAYELGKTNWGWSWMERWIAARPWEYRIPVQFISPKKIQSKQVNKVGESTNTPAIKIYVSVKPELSDGKGATKARRVTDSNAEMPTAQEANAED